MKLVSAACPSCRARIQIPPDQDRVFCSYCGSQILAEAAIAYGKTKIEGVVETRSADFVIEAGELKEYHGAAADVAVPDGVIAIGREAFRNMPISSVALPEGIKEFAYGAFMQCKRLECITIPASVREIGDGCFGYCDSLKEVVMEEGVSRVGGYCFHRCQLLENIVIPASVVSIGEHAFEQCGSLTSVTFLNPATQIPCNAFHECESLESVMATGGSLKNSAQGAFHGTPWKDAQIKKARRSKGLCEHCGGAFKGLFTKTCSVCGEEKSY